MTTPKRLHNLADQCEALDAADTVAADTLALEVAKAVGLAPQDSRRAWPDLNECTMEWETDLDAGPLLNCTANLQDAADMAEKVLEQPNYTVGRATRCSIVYCAGVFWGIGHGANGHHPTIPAAALTAAVLRALRAKAEDEGGRK